MVDTTTERNVALLKNTVPSLILKQIKLMVQEFTRELTQNSLLRIDENTQKLTSCLNELEEADVWKRPNSHSNSVGNIILHLCGNMRQYAISSLGNMKDVRERDKEFSTDGGYSRSELLDKLRNTLEEAKSIIQSTTETELLRKRKVQGYMHSGIGIIIHVTEHYSYHTGQIIFWTKLLKDKDLGFYAGIDLNVKNEP
jgi:uncharacterized damage-inducible protein DinB